VQADAGVAVLVVVVVEERGAEAASVLDGAEPVGEGRAVLEGLELGFAVGVVVGHMRSAVRAGDAEIDEELGDWFRGHRGAPVRVQGELVTPDALGLESTVDELLGELAGLGRCHGPCDDVAGEDVDDHEQLVVHAAFGTPELGDIPRPHPVRCRGQELGSFLGGMGALAASFTVLPRDGQQPVHGRDRAQVDAVVEQPGPDLCGGGIAELLGSQHVQDVLAFGFGQLVGRLGPWDRRAQHRGLAMPVARRSGHAQQRTGRLDRRRLLEGRQVLVDHGLDRVSVSALSESFSKSACNFPVISKAVFVASSSSSSALLRRRSFSSSTWSAERFAFGFGASAAAAPASRARRHSAMCDVYKPSRRNNAPRSVEPFGNASYSSTIDALYSAVKVRRRGLSAGSGSPIGPSWARSSNDAVVMVICVKVPVSPCSDGGLPQVSHPTLTDRATPTSASNATTSCPTPNAPTSWRSNSPTSWSCATTPKPAAGPTKPPATTA